MSIFKTNSLIENIKNVGYALFFIAVLPVALVVLLNLMPRPPTLVQLVGFSLVALSLTLVFIAALGLVSIEWHSLPKYDKSWVKALLCGMKILQIEIGVLLYVVLNLVAFFSMLLFGPLY